MGKIQVLTILVFFIVISTNSLANARSFTTTNDNQLKNSTTSSDVQQIVVQKFPRFQPVFLVNGQNGGGGSGGSGGAGGSGGGSGGTPPNPRPAGPSGNQPAAPAQQQPNMQAFIVGLQNGLSMEQAFVLSTQHQHMPGGAAPMLAQHQDQMVRLRGGAPMQLPAGAGGRSQIFPLPNVPRQPRGLAPPPILRPQQPYQPAAAGIMSPAEQQWRNAYLQTIGQLAAQLQPMQLPGGQLLQFDPATGGFVARQPPATVQLAPGPGGRVPPHTLVAGTSAGSYGQGTSSAGRGTSGQGTSASGQQQSHQPSISSSQVQPIGGGQRRPSVIQQAGGSGQGPSRRRPFVAVDDADDQQPSSSSGSRGHHPQKMSRQYVASMFPTVPSPTSPSLQQQPQQQQPQPRQQQQSYEEMYYSFLKQQPPRQRQQQQLPAAGQRQQPRVTNLERAQQDQLVQAYIDADPDLQAALRYRQHSKRKDSKNMKKRMPPRLAIAFNDAIQALSQLGGGVITNGRIQAMLGVHEKVLKQIQAAANLARGSGRTWPRVADEEEMRQLQGRIGRTIDRSTLNRPSNLPIGRRRSSSPPSAAGSSSRRNRQQSRQERRRRNGTGRRRSTNTSHSRSPASRSRGPFPPLNLGRGGNLGGRRRRKRSATTMNGRGGGGRSL